jgi:hypothetical protein
LVLYLEGSTDLKMLRAFAKKLNHDAATEVLKEIFSHTVSHKLEKNLNTAKQHFTALKSSFSESRGLGIFDGDNSAKENDTSIPNLTATWWKRCELENYFFCKETFLEYSSNFSSSKSDEDDLLPLLNYTDSAIEVDAREIMNKILKDKIAPEAFRNKNHEFWHTAKASEWFEKILKEFFTKLKQPHTSKKNFYELIEFMPKKLIDEEVREKLDLIASSAHSQKKQKT